jgi:ADP-heptose:LPS heptosyltransferase
LKKILIIRFSSIGDIVLTTPVIRCLKTQLGDVEIHYLTKTQNHQLLKANPFITKIWLYERNFRDLLPLLKKENFDHIVDLHKNLRSQYVLFNLRKPFSTFKKLNLKKWMIVNLKIDILPRIHIVERYMASLKSLGIRNDNKGLDYFIHPDEEIELSVFPEQFRHGYIAIVIGGKHVTKILPEDKVVEFCRNISQPAILLGGKEDEERGRRITQLAGPSVFNACGRFSVNQGASLIRQAMNVITNDTGFIHIAAAYGKTILSIWGNTIPEFGMYPYLVGKENAVSAIFEVKNLSCRPCSKIGFEKCPKGHFRCMKDQDINAMVSFINR